MQREKFSIDQGEEQKCKNYFAAIKFEKKKFYNKNLIMQTNILNES